MVEVGAHCQPHGFLVGRPVGAMVEAGRASVSFVLKKSLPGLPTSQYMVGLGVGKKDGDPVGLKVGVLVGLKVGLAVGLGNVG